MKVSCTPVSLATRFNEEQDFTIRDFIELCAELNMDGVDIMDSIRYPWQWRDVASELKGIPGWAKAAGLEIAAYACGNNFTKKADAEFEEQVNIVKNALREAAAVGAPLLRIFGGTHPHLPNGELSHAAGLKRVVQGIEACLPEAEKCGVVLALENHGCMPGHSWEIKRLMDHFSSPWLKVMFDCANFRANNMDEVEDPIRAFECLKDYVVHIHYKDFMDNDHPEDGRKVRACVAGEGFIPLRQLAAGFEENGFNGYFSLEYEAGQYTPEMEGVKRSTGYINEVKEAVKLFL